MNAFQILNFVHDEDKFFAYHFCLLTFCIAFEPYIGSCCLFPTGKRVL